VLEKWLTKDAKICYYADENDLIIITKDQDFKNSYIFQKTPKKLIRVVLGNISNERLIELFEKHLNLIISLKDQNQFFVEIGESFVLY
jgi:predicted nuclease of predicted toxin-antitoxin system